MTLIDLPTIIPGEKRRHPYSFYDATSVLATTATSAFRTENMTGCVVWFKGVSSAGTPNLTLTLETSKDDVNANYLQVNADANPTLPVTITDENVHVIAINFAQMHDYARFKITLNGADPGDDVLTMRVCFLYGEFTHPQSVSVIADTEFPAAALLADNTAVPTTTLVGAILMGYDGTNIDFVRKDSNGALLVNPGALVYTSDSVTATTNQTTVGHGHKEVTTAGTDVVLAGSTACKRVTIQAYLANTGKIAVGGSGVDASATIGTGTGALLSAGESISFDIANLDAIYIDSTINGEGVRYIYQN